MADANRSTSAVAAAAKGAASGVRKEWDRTNTLGGVVEYAFLPKEARLVYAAGRVTVAATRGAVAGHRAHKAAVVDSQLRIVPPLAEETTTAKDA